MKNKCAFTLIELLAIIVILAIIAVITVPIILNIIDSSKKGAAIDSAYGYIDVFDNALVSHLYSDLNYSINDNTYSVDQLDSQIGTLLSGRKPLSNSWVTIENNNIVDGCLQFDDFKVEIKDSQIQSAEKGQCLELQIPSCPGCVFAFLDEAYYLPEEDRTILSEVDYETDYVNIGKNYFLGLVLDKNNMINRAFSCGIFRENVNDAGTPFCLEGTVDGSKDVLNRKILTSLYGEFDDVLYSGCSDYSDGQILGCYGSVDASSESNGSVGIDYFDDYCFVANDGYIECHEE